MTDREPRDNIEERSLELRYHQLQNIFRHFMTLEDDKRDEAYKAIVSFLEKSVDEDLIRYMTEHALYSQQLKRNVELGLHETCDVAGAEIPEFNLNGPYVAAKVAADGTIEGVAHNLDAEDDPGLRKVFGHVTLLKALSPEHLHHLGMAGGIRVPANYEKLKSIGYKRHGGSNERPVVHYHGGASIGTSGRVGNKTFIEALLGRDMADEWEEAGLMDYRLSDATAYAAANGKAARNVPAPIRSPETHEIDQ